MEQSRAGDKNLSFHCGGQLAGSGLWTRLRLQYLILAIGFAILPLPSSSRDFCLLLKSWDFLVVSLPLFNQIWPCLALVSAKVS